MKFENFQKLIKDLPYFELSLLTQLTGESNTSMSLQLYRWAKKNYIISLRRGMFAMAEPFQKVPIPVLTLTNDLYRPSYISHLFALSYYGLIPEKVVTYSSVSTRVTRDFENPLGKFTYFNVHRKFFWGYSSNKSSNADFWIATPEKALLDYFHLELGEWTKDRLVEMRFQNVSIIDITILNSFATKWNKPRIDRAISNFIELIQDGEISQ